MLKSGHYSAFQHIEQVIKLFYARFKVERSTFQRCFSCPDSRISIIEQEQLASLLLNRLMFLYFLQKQGFLNHDLLYLSHQLQATRQRAGPDTFYASFLWPLFHQGLDSPVHTPEIVARLGQVPYLGGSLFALRKVEEHYHSITIPDSAFERLFTFFDLYRWHVDEPAGQEKSLLTPDVLGYIFEQYINQQQMGAYYTREDVTTYIASNTIIPAFFDHMTHLYPAMFGPAGPIWSLLQQQPERYISAILLEQNYLPDETPHEYEQRQQAIQKLLTSLETGQVTAIDALISSNLEINRFAVDALQSLNDPQILLACYHHLTQLSILDPTCGSGAFLLAALRVLLPLYEACLDQLEKINIIVSTIYTSQRSRRYNVLKTIITCNLYGIDIMEEAIEICKLHLYLKLLALIEQVEDIEPLPDIEQHILVGNTLIELQDITMPASPAIYQATIPPQAQWQYSFQNILSQGGFNVIIGNPPYVEYSEQTFPYALKHFVTRCCANLYTCVVERSHQLLSAHGRHGMILPLAAFATRNMQPFLSAFLRWFPVSWLSFYHFRPSMLFSGGKVASIPTAIYLAKPEGSVQRYSTRLIKWAQEQRPLLFSRLIYHAITAPPDPLNLHYYPKFSHPVEDEILKKLLLHQPVSNYVSRIPNANTMFYRTAGGLYWKVFVNFPWPYETTSNKQCFFQQNYDRDVFVALFNSSLFWWYYTVTFDTFNLKDYMLFGFRFNYPTQSSIIQQLQDLNQQLMDDYCRYARHLKRGQTGSYTVYARKSKAIIDRIDMLLAQHYGLSANELAFIINYDIKYRMRLAQPEV
ncbi:hypothetical protein KDA_02100 [Dictyobacter alpinus]|uniref:site-specific DNA-methyltransferase (adenine-specific) n=1 Tax=Dictyobacter alpinus TaxID=2014873 RepID=A0A402B053_9CHLR|nr:DNA methyltransferase [Dictyobacter alpinus]GCE24726.1 hypothetical protein KDA_02100 [Dictyobacter alpinus]